jgi:hypothetical protein
MTLFSNKTNRVVAFVSFDGTVEVYTKENFNSSSVLFPFLDANLNILDSSEQLGIQYKTLNVYEDVMHAPDQTIYSIPYSINKMPDRSTIVPKDVFNIVWNYLEGAKGKKEPNKFMLQTESKVS